VRLTRIYTKTGDQGGTTLASGEKISKAAGRLEAYGTVDELNSWMGLLRDQVRLQKVFEGHWLDLSLERIQNELFDLGGELATPSKSLNIERQRVVSKDDVTCLEEEIDSINENLKPLANFVLPGGHTCNSTAHLARTVCRRAERELVRLRIDEPDIRGETQMYLNRLSDWLFVISRFISQQLGCAEVLWKQNRPSAPKPNS
jgi:cob(I)alamin adenosyltransferase